MASRDYYEILGVSRQADDKELKRSFRRLAMKYHPDRNKGDKDAERQFKEVKEAYDVLSDPKKRQLYDQYGHEGIHMHGQQRSSSEGFDFSDVFGDMFGDIFSGGQRRGQRRGADLKYTAVLTLEEAVAGKQLRIDIPSWETCDVCEGRGAEPGTAPVTCEQCQGHGQIRVQQGFFSIQQTCPVCAGQGRVIQSPCSACRGEGRKQVDQQLEVNIPAGVEHGDQIRLSGKGEAPGSGIQPGDLYIQVQIRPHHFFQREGHHLTCQVPVNFVTAALGGSVTVPTLDGQVHLKIPPETQTGQSLRLRGRGVRSVRDGSKGDLICQVVLETPVNLSKEQKSILQDLKETFDDDYHNPKAKSWFDNVKNFFDGIRPS